MPKATSRAAIIARRAVKSLSGPKFTRSRVPSGTKPPLSRPGPNRSSAGLASFEQRFPFLQESPGPLLHVFGGAKKAEKGRFESEPFLGRHGKAAVDGFESIPNGERSSGEDGSGESLRLGQELLRRDHPVDEAYSVGLGGIDHVTRQDQLLRFPPPDEARETLSPAIPRNDAQIHFGLAESSAGRRDPKRAGEGDLATSAQSIPVHGRQDRFAEGLDPGEDRLPEEGISPPLQGRLLGEFADVGAGDERFGAGPRQDDRPHLRILPEPPKDIIQFLQSCAIQRIEFFRAVDRDPRQRSLCFHEKVLDPHLLSLPPEVRPRPSAGSAVTAAPGSSRRNPCQSFARAFPPGPFA